MENCLFCQIISRKIPAEVVFEDERLLAFRDIEPKAPIHILIIPKVHISTLDDIKTDHKELVGHIIKVASELARVEGISDTGYRTVFNCKKDGGQTVYHIHLHLLGGRELTWPPG
tara:strand:- start:2912 stop:3256 length:345 start_codon:yes stop_codon:yes gene_type:complete